MATVTSQAVGPEFRVNTYTSNDQRQEGALGGATTATLSNGGFVVTWQSFGQDGSGFGIYGQRYSAAGAAAGSEFRINTTTAATSVQQVDSAQAGVPQFGSWAAGPSATVRVSKAGQLNLLRSRLK